MNNNTTVNPFMPLLLAALFSASAPHTALAFNAEHLATLEAGINAWNRMRAGTPGMVPDLSEAVLKGRNLQGADLHDANLERSDLSQSNLGKTNLRNARLSRADLSGSTIMRADLTGADLRETDLESAVLDGSKLHKARLNGAILKKADCTNALFPEADLSACNLREASLVSANLESADLSGAYLWRANLSGAEMKGMKVSDVTILDTGKYATAAWAEKHGAVFAANPVTAVEPVASEEKKEEEQLSRNTSQDTEIQKQGSGGNKTGNAAISEEKTAPSGNIWRKSGSEEKKISSGNIWRQASDGPLHVTYDREQFSMLKSNALKWNSMRKRDRNMRVELKGAPFNRKNLVYADLVNASLSGAGFRAADLSESDLRFADLSGCDFREANLQHADLGGADLRGANLWRANLSRARMEGAIVSGRTVLDTGKKATPELAERYGMTFRPE